MWDIIYCTDAHMHTTVEKKYVMALLQTLKNHTYIKNVQLRSLITYMLKEKKENRKTKPE